MTELKNNLKSQLLKKRITLSGLSKMAQVPKTNIHSWLLGSNPNLTQLKRVADTLEVSIYELAFGISDPFKPNGEANRHFLASR